MATNRFLGLLEADSDSASTSDDGAAPTRAPPPPPPPPLPPARGAASGRADDERSTAASSADATSARAPRAARGDEARKGTPADARARPAARAAAVPPRRREVAVLEPGEEPVEGFSLRGAVLGRGGENLRAIQDLAGVRAWLAGCGAGVEGAPEEPGPLRVVLQGGRGGDIQRAVDLAEDLVETVRERHRARRQAIAARQDRRGRASEVSGFVRQLREEKERTDAMVDEAKRKEREAWLDHKEALEASRASRGQKVQLFQHEPLTEEAQRARRAATCPDSSPKAASAGAREFWRALESARQEASAPEVRAEALRLQKDAFRARTAPQEGRQRALALRQEAQAAQVRAAGNQRLLDALTDGSGRRQRAERCCALFASGSCPFEPAEQCPRGSHKAPDAPREQEVFRMTTKAKLRLVQQKWSEAGGRGELLNAWQVRNAHLDFLFRGAEANFCELYGQTPDVIDAWHGSAEENLVSIAVHGFDPRRRSGQVYGAGEYFAKDPAVSVGYARGGSFMFLCKLLLGKKDVDHTWAAGPRYYVIKQREGRMQVLPIFLVLFKPSSSPFHLRLVGELAAARDAEDTGELAGRQRGGLLACEGRRDAGMDAQSTRHLWLGWLDPRLRSADDEEIERDVRGFLAGVAVEQVAPERNGARVGAFVLLEEPIPRATFRDLARRKYRGQWTISVDDAQPGNPRCARQVCPRLSGPSKYCRGWNIRGHAAWQWGCAYDHPEGLRPTAAAEPSFEEVPRGSAKWDEIETEMRQSMPSARVLRIRRSQNPALERMYDDRRTFIQDKQGFAVEKELWHGTSVAALPTLLKHGLQPPADSVPSASCPVSGGRGLCTTLCGTGCAHCTGAHGWGKCHMYGLGVYLADVAQKSHQYVRSSGGACSMLRCRVCLGNPYLIEGNLLSGSIMHDLCWCRDPGEFLESVAEDWSVMKGHDSFFVKGQVGKQKAGLGVYNSEYIVFQPYQILPLYQVDYEIS